MGRQVGRRDRVAIGEQPVQLPATITTGAACPTVPPGKAYSIWSMQITAVGAIGLDRVGMGPRAKRARQLAIAKLPAGDIVAMFQPPGEFSAGRAIAAA